MSVDLSYKLQKLPTDIALPSLISLAASVVFVGLGWLLITVFISGVDALSELGKNMVRDADTEYVDSVIGQLQDSLLRRLIIGATIAFVAAFFWYLLLWIKPIARVGEARARRGVWFGLLNVVILGFAALFILPLLPMVASMLGDTFAARAGVPVYIVSGIGGVAGITFAFWLATAAGTPKYARTAVPGASILPF